MRPRFSLKWLLIAVTVVAVACTCGLRPTVLARQLKNSARDRQYALLGSIDVRGGPLKDVMAARVIDFNGFGDINTVVEPSPLSWEDILRMRRRLIVCLTYENSRSTSYPRAHFHSTERYADIIDLTVDISGIFRVDREEHRLMGTSSGSSSW